MTAYHAPPTVGQFLASDAFIRMLIGPVGSGKSSGCCIEIIRRAIETPANPLDHEHDFCPPGRCLGIRRSRWAVVRNTYPELRDTTIKTFLEWVPEGVFGRWRGGDHTFELDFETEEGIRVQGEVLFRALDRPADVKKLLSLELTGCYFNEAKEIPKPIFDVMQGRVGRYPRKEDVSRYWSGVFGDTNPFDTDHYMFALFEEERPEGHERFKQPSGLLPGPPHYNAFAENVTNLDRCWDVDAELIGQARELAKQEQRERLERQEHEPMCRCYYVRQMRGKGIDWINVYLRGEYGFVLEGKAVYPEFIDSVHVAKETIPLLPNVHELILGNDYGLTPAAVWIQEDPSDGQLQVVREFVSERLGAINFGKEQHRLCVKHFNGKKIIGWGDPAGDAASQIDEDITPIDCVRASGVPMNPAPTNDWTPRRESVANALMTLTPRGRPGLIIDPSCKILRKGMTSGYVYRRLQVTGDARYEDKPLKNRFSHVCEALQYALVGLGRDYAALDGRHGLQNRGKVRVHRALGSGRAERDRPELEDNDDRFVHVPKVRRRLE